MKNQNVSKAPVVLIGAKSGTQLKQICVGFFDELPTCDTIEEGLKSFDDLAKYRLLNSKKLFQYKG
jgi:hypothetical protein